MVIVTVFSSVWMVMHDNFNFSDNCPNYVHPEKVSACSLYLLVFLEGVRSWASSFLIFVSSIFVSDTSSTSSFTSLVFPTFIWSAIVLFAARGCDPDVVASRIQIFQTPLGKLLQPHVSLKMTLHVSHLCQPPSFLCMWNQFAVESYKLMIIFNIAFSSVCGSVFVRGAHLKWRFVAFCVVTGMLLGFHVSRFFFYSVHVDPNMSLHYSRLLALDSW